MANELAADLPVSAGRHPAGARHLAVTSGQPAEVIDLVEARLRRSEARPAHETRRSDRGLELIDQWSSGVGEAAAIAGQPTPEPQPPAA